MSDAIVVFHPVDASKLEPLLDLDEDSSDSPNPYAEKLDDGTYLVHTFQPFATFTEDPELLGDWLEHFAEVIEVMHDDPRGLFVFPDDVELEAEGYAALVDEVGDRGAFFMLDPEDAIEGLDMDALGAIASQFMQGAAPGGAGSFEIGQLIQNMQGQIAEALGVQLPKTDDEPKGGEPAAKKDDAG